MNYTALTRRFAHPGIWGHEQGNLVKPTMLDQQSNTSDQELWESLCTSLDGLQGRDDQWVTVVGTPGKALIEQLIAAGIRPDRIRRVAVNNHEEAVWATEQALLINNSQLVIAWIGDCQGRDKQRIELAARVSQARSILFTAKNHKIAMH